MDLMPNAFELRTPRLTLRMLDRRDITAFTRYRNVESVARYQDWPLPYTRDLAHQLVDEMDQLDGPTAGGWVQIAIEHDGQLVGDVAVWLDANGEFAMIGYTVAPEHQGQSYAVEATAAMLSYLFDELRVHRVAATIDPRNMASARVLERCGFEYVGTARAAAFSRGVWTDDARFSLLADDWRCWVARPTGPPRTVSFVEIDGTNVHAVSEITVAHSQRRFVRSTAESIAEAAHPPFVTGAPLVPWYRAIRADDCLAGFVLVAMRSPEHPISHLWRLLIDQRHQRRGIARRSIAVLARTLSELGETQLLASFVDEPGGPEAFYRALGFQRTGNIDARTGEVLAIADLIDLTG